MAYSHTLCVFSKWDPQYVGEIVNKFKLSTISNTETKGTKTLINLYIRKNI